MRSSDALKDKLLQIWYCPDCHTGDPPLTKMPKTVVADVWGALDYAANACKAGYRSVMSMSRGPNATLGEAGAGWCKLAALMRSRLCRYLPACHRWRDPLLLMYRIVTPSSDLPPFGGADGGKWPGTWARDLDAELAARGCDKEGRDTLVMGGSVRSTEPGTF
eukprot:SAG22_NODE_1825_length_3505_cov_3.818849_5_plen_163_part_00